MGSLTKVGTWPSTSLSLKPEVIIGSRLTTLIYYITIFGYTPLDLRLLKYRIFQVNWRHSWLQAAFFILFLYIAVENISTYSFQRPIFLHEGAKLFAQTWKSGLGKTDNAVHLRETGDYAVRLVFGLIPIALVTGFITLWMSSQRLSAILTGWGDFEKRCHRMCTSTVPNAQNTSGPAGHRNWINRKLLYAFVVHTVFGLLFWLPLMYQVHPKISIISYEYIYYCFSGILSVTLDYLYEGFNIAMIHCCETAFRLVKNSIEAFIIAAEESHPTLTAVQVKAIQDLVFEVRSRTRETCKLQKWPLVACIVQLIALACLAAFVISLSYRAGEKQLLLASIMWGSYTVDQICRLGLKAHFGDRLASAELEIKFLLEGVNDQRFDMLAKSQLNILLNTIKNCPCQARFGTCIVLNKRLVLGVLQNIVGYVIIILQFTQRA